MRLKKRINLINARNKKGESQQRTADGLKVSISTYSYIEQGRRNPSDDLKKRIANYFGYSVGYLFFNEPITNSDKEKQPS